jgi:hypothetical protein
MSQPIFLQDEAGFDTVYEALIDAGYSPRSYSGRGMYGESCVGLALESETDLLKVGAALGERLAQRSFRTDSLGMGIIAYWPREKWQEDYVEGEGDDY